MASVTTTATTSAEFFLQNEAVSKALQESCPKIRKTLLKQQKAFNEAEKSAMKDKLKTFFEKNPSLGADLKVATLEAHLNETSLTKTTQKQKKWEVKLTAGQNHAEYSLEFYNLAGKRSPIVFRFNTTSPLTHTLVKELQQRMVSPPRDTPHSCSNTLNSGHGSLTSSGYGGSTVGSLRSHQALFYMSVSPSTSPVFTPGASNHNGHVNMISRSRDSGTYREDTDMGVPQDEGIHLEQRQNQYSQVLADPGAVYDYVDIPDTKTSFHGQMNHQDCVGGGVDYIFMDKDEDTHLDKEQQYNHVLVESGSARDYQNLEGSVAAAPKRGGASRNSGSASYDPLVLAKAQKVFADRFLHKVGEKRIAAGAYNRTDSATMTIASSKESGSSCAGISQGIPNPAYTETDDFIGRGAVGRSPFDTEGGAVTQYSSLMRSTPEGTAGVFSSDTTTSGYGELNGSQYVNMSILPAARSSKAKTGSSAVFPSPPALPPKPAAMPPVAEKTIQRDGHSYKLLSVALPGLYYRKATEEYNDETVNTSYYYMEATNQDFMIRHYPDRDMKLAYKVTGQAWVESNEIYHLLGSR